MNNASEKDTDSM